MKNSIKKLWFVVFCPLLPLMGQPNEFQLSPEQLASIGKRIWQNEAGQSYEKLTWWVQGENWASLGIGHFIWYPENMQAQYTEQFPALLVFLQENKVQLPAWLKSQACPTCPWATRDDFFKNFDSEQMKNLREMLASTIDLQMKFILQRASVVLDKMLDTIKSNKKKTHIKEQYHRVAQHPQGLYALIDYINFKGEGISIQERYNKQGWGLLQVLQQMHGSQPQQAVQEFATIAQKLLTLRVHNAPKEKNEQQFLAGWKKRINTYLTPL